MHIIDMQTSRDMATFGVGEHTECMKFTPDCKHVISCTARGSYYVWRLPKNVYNTIIFKQKQKDVDSSQPNFAGSMLSNITEDKSEGEDEFDEGISPQSIKRKEWNASTRKSILEDPNYNPSLLGKKLDTSENQGRLERLKSQNEQSLELIKIEGLNQSLKTDYNDDVDVDVMVDDMSDDEDDNVFSLGPETPKIGQDNSRESKKKYQFDDGSPDRKRRVTAFHRRDSRIGMLIGKSGKIHND